MISIHILAEQGDFQRARFHQPPRLRQHLGDRPRKFGLRAYRVPRRMSRIYRTPPAPTGTPPRRADLPPRATHRICFQGEIRCRARFRPPPALRAPPFPAGGDRFAGRTPCPHRARGAAISAPSACATQSRHRHNHALAVCRSGLLMIPDAAKVTEHFFGGFFADMAGVQNDHIRPLRPHPPGDSRAAPTHQPCGHCHRHSSDSPQVLI